MMKIDQHSKISLVSILLALLLSFVPTTTVLADVAPPEMPPGANPHPGTEVTQVRMVAETVLIEVLDTAPEVGLGQARVSAEFLMQNLGSQTETLRVRFPISSNDGFYNYPEINDFRVEVDGSQVSSSPAEYEGGNFDDLVQWAEFDVSFPPGEDVIIEVSYTLEGTGEYPFIAFKYLLETGAGWKDTIGSADLIVRLPYEANPHNVFIDSSPGWGHTSPGATLEGSEIRWHYDDLEPEYQHNLSIAMVMPSAWAKVLTERKNVANKPDDGEAWGRLGKTYKETALLRRGIRRDAGGQELYELSRQAYERCLELLPDDALWHLGYANLLFARYYWEEYAIGGTQRANLLKAIEEYSIAYNLDPDNETIIYWIDEAYYATDAIERLEDGNGYTFHWLTSTPTIVPTRTLTASDTPTPAPTATATPLPPTVTQGPTNSPQLTTTPKGFEAQPSAETTPSLPICGSLLIIPLGLALIFVMGVNGPKTKASKFSSRRR